MKKRRKRRRRPSRWPKPGEIVKGDDHLIHKIKTTSTYHDCDRLICSWFTVCGLEDKAHPKVFRKLRVQKPDTQITCLLCLDKMSDVSFQLSDIFNMGAFISGRKLHP